MFTDEALIADLRDEMASTWNGEAHLSSYAAAAGEALGNARAAIAKGIQPTSEAASVIAREWLDRLAKLMKCDAKEAFMQWARRHNVHSLRFRRLLAVLDGDDRKAEFSSEWLWINEAVSSLAGESA